MLSCARKGGHFMQTILLIFTLLLRLFSLYFLVVGFFALKKPGAIPTAPPRTHFACLIAARNEEAVIADLVASLRAQNYPPELCHIYVIPNNCTDNTEAAARAAGADILRCLRPVRCKGDALHEAVGRLMSQPYDAFCVFDADNIVHPDFLARMNDAFQAGAQVCKGAMRVKNPEAGPLAGCYGLYYTLFDRFYSRARMNCGLSAKLVGTGFAVRREVFETLGGWNTRTIAEDAEFAAQCAARGIRVRFVPTALTYDEAPTSLALSLRQRRRWCSGLMDVADRNRAALTRAVPGPGKFLAVDSLLMLHSPYVQALSVLPAVLSLLTAALTGAGPGLAALPAALGSSYLLCAVGGLILARLGGYGGLAAVGAVLAFPLFMASWLPLQVLSALRRTRTWQPIRHGVAALPRRN